MPYTTKTAASLKLFPRLAQRAKKATTVRRDRPTASERVVTPLGVNNEREAKRVQVRARLLRMILNNEDSRRNGPRPNAS
jgi:hypothetical protein